MWHPHTGLQRRLAKVEGCYPLDKEFLLTDVFHINLPDPDRTDVADVATRGS
jgi:hypothetical protein